MSEKRTRKFNIAFTDSEHDRIKQYAEKSELSISEFIREAIRNKIRTIEHPEYYNGIVKEVKNGLHQQKTRANHQQVEIDYKLATLKEQFSQLKTISSQKVTNLYQSDVERIRAVLREKSEATMAEIQKATKLDKEVLNKILTDNRIFSTNLKGKYKLKGDK